MNRIFAFKTHYQKVKEFYKRYERWLMPVTLSLGFVADYVTFISIQINTALVLLFVYWLAAALALTFIYAYDAGRVPEKYKYIRLFLPLLVQFTFGGLLSNSFIFYWFSGSIWVSWPFILAFVFLMVANEALREHFFKPAVQLSVYFFATFSIISVTLPFVFNSLSPWLFVVSGAAALALFALFALFLNIFSPQIKLLRFKLAVSAVCILLAADFFYFTNLIPPVPLAIREAGVYHYAAKSGGEYILKSESQSFWQKLIPGQSIHLAPGERAYVFTAIFAPKNFNTPIIHEWQYYDEAKGVWTMKDKLSFTLIGGRQEGFRGYSLKTVLPEGRWRVYIKTSRGQTLGRVKFNIKKVDVRVDLEEVLK